MPERTLQFSEIKLDYDGVDHPKLVPGVMQVFWKDGHPEMVDFLCPCGCGRSCPTYLIRPDRPRKPDSRHFWDYIPGDDQSGPTLSPSVWWQSGCHAHFTITGGRVQFHP